MASSPDLSPPPNILPPLYPSMVGHHHVPPAVTVIQQTKEQQTSMTSKTTSATKKAAPSQPAAPAEITRIGNLTADPELRFIPDGTAVCNFRLAYQPYNRETKERGETVYYGVAAWRELGEHVAQTLRKGMRAIVVGTPSTREWEGDDGETHIEKEITASAVGPDLRWATAEVTRTNPGRLTTGTHDEESF